MKKLFLLFSVCVSGIASAQIITIPDANFKNALVSTSCVDSDGNGTFNADADTNNDGEIQQSEALAVTALRVSNQMINSLDGIAYFSNLTVLECTYNQLTTLDVSGLMSLITLSCGYNQLTTLNVSGLNNLNWLYCRSNQLTTLDVSGLTSLRELNCVDNQLATLDVSESTNLIRLYGQNNQLTNLDLSGLTHLIYLDCSNNQLTTLDASELTSANVFYCYNNQLSSLFIKNGSIESLNFANNYNLSFICCDASQIIFVQNLVNSYGLTNCVISSNCNVAIEPVSSTKAITLNLYPNPAENTLYIPTDVQISQADIFDMKGALVRSVSVRNNQIEVQGLSSGTYFTRLYGDAKLYSAKFMVK